MEDQAAESNGAGKSALAMSAVWALTGHSDARNEVNCTSALVFSACHSLSICFDRAGATVSCHTGTMVIKG